MVSAQTIPKQFIQPNAVQIRMEMLALLAAVEVPLQYLVTLKLVHNLIQYIRVQVLQLFSQF